MRAVIEAAYKWRAAEVHHAACRLKVRQGDEEEAGEGVVETLRQLRIKIDGLHREDKQR